MRRSFSIVLSVALKIASGKYITVHDADDWSHPQKIEIQAEHLEANRDVVANVSEGARVDESTLQTGIVGRTHILRANFSSLMFRREPVESALGYWDEVRFGGDSEFQNRLVSCFGEDAIVTLKTGLVSLLRIVQTSLTAGGIEETLTGARRLYRNSFRNWHSYLALSGGSFYLETSKPRRFYAPRQSLGLPQTPVRYDLVVISDFSMPIVENPPVLQIIQDALMANLAIAIAHVPRLDSMSTPPAMEVEAFCLENSIEQLWHAAREIGDDPIFEATELMIAENSLEARYDRIVRIAAKSNTILCHVDASRTAAHTQKLLNTFKAMFRSEPQFVEFGEDACRAIAELKANKEFARFLDQA